MIRGPLATVHSRTKGAKGLVPPMTNPTTAPHDKPDDQKDSVPGGAGPARQRRTGRSAYSGACGGESSTMHISLGVNGQPLAPDVAPRMLLVPYLREGLAPNGLLNPVQEGFKECFALQCGFCTPGMILASIALLTSNPDPSEDEVRWALSGNICRCTGYVNIVKAVQWAAQKMKATAAPPTGMGAILAGNAGLAGPGSTPGSSHGGRDGA